MVVANFATTIPRWVIVLSCFELLPKWFAKIRSLCYDDLQKVTIQYYGHIVCVLLWSELLPKRVQTDQGGFG